MVSIGIDESVRFDDICEVADWKFCLLSASFLGDFGVFDRCL